MKCNTIYDAPAITFSSNRDGLLERMYDAAVTTRPFHKDDYPYLPILFRFPGHSG
jgi:hypothetical protein